MSFNREKYERSKAELTLKLMKLPPNSAERSEGGELLMRLVRLGQDLNFLESLSGPLTTEQVEERQRVQELAAQWKEKLANTDQIIEQVVPKDSSWMDLYFFLLEFTVELTLAQGYIQSMADQLLENSEAA
jgi:hypothetical protein